jgi:hypothetical protein
VYVVDAANGPGAHFTTIAAAVALVPDGSILLVRAGTYGGFTIDAKGLIVFGSIGTVVTAAVTVRNTTGSQTVVLTDMHALSLGFQDCAGLVGVERVDLTTTARHPLYGYLLGGDVWAMNCSRVLLEAITTSQVTTLTASAAVLRDCMLRGDSSYINYGQGLPQTVHAQPGLTIHRGSTTLLGGTVMPGISTSGVLAPSIAVDQVDLRVLRGTLWGSLFGLIPGGPAVVGTGSVRIDPATTFSNLGSFQPTAVSPPSTTLDMPSLTTNDPVLGGTTAATLADPVGHLAIQFVGIPGPPAAVPGLADAMWLDPIVHLIQQIGTAPMTSYATVPNAPYLLGVVLAWQGVTYDPVAGLQASNAAISIVH